MHSLALHIARIGRAFLGMEESEQSKVFRNEAFGYWKVTVERPLRVIGIEPDRAYSAKEIREFKAAGRVDESGVPVVKKIHKKTTADPLHGLFSLQVDGKKLVVEYEPDPDLRDTEQIPLLEKGGIPAFFRREVLPHVPDAWIDREATRVGYEISFTRHFYTPPKLRTLAEIRADIEALERETEGLLGEILVDVEGAA